MNKRIIELYFLGVNCAFFIPNNAIKTPLSDHLGTGELGSINRKKLRVNFENSGKDMLCFREYRRHVVRKCRLITGPC